MMPAGWSLLRRLVITLLVGWPLTASVTVGGLLGMLSPAFLGWVGLTLPVALLAWRGRTRLLRAASYVGVSVLYGAWSMALLFLHERPSRFDRFDGAPRASVFGLVDDPVRDQTAGVALAMLLSGLVGAALLSLIEWAWEHLERRRAAARVGSDTPS